MKNLAYLESIKADVQTCLLGEAAINVQKLAWDKIHLENKSPEELVFFCIDTNTKWFVLAEQLNNDEVDEAMQTTSAVSVIWGCADISFYEFLANTILNKEEIRSIQEITPTSGKVKYLVFYDQGVDIREIVPRNVSALK